MSIIVFAYCLFRDIIGRSLGKVLVGIKIADKSGKSNCTVLQRIVRNILFVIYPVEFVLIILDKATIGDRLSSTYVTEYSGKEKLSDIKETDVKVEELCNSSDGKYLYTVPRLYAAIIDLVLIAVSTCFVGIIVANITSNRTVTKIIYFVTGIIMFIIKDAWLYNRSVGKRIMRLKTANLSDGRPANIWQSLLRGFASLTLLIDILFILLNNGVGTTDIISKTRVICA